MADVLVVKGEEAENIFDYGMQNLLQSRMSGGMLPQKKKINHFLCSHTSFPMPMIYYLLLSTHKCQWTMSLSIIIIILTSVAPLCFCPCTLPPLTPVVLSVFAMSIIIKYYYLAVTLIMNNDIDTLRFNIPIIIIVISIQNNIATIAK